MAVFVFIQRLTYREKRHTVATLTALLTSRGVSVFAHKEDNVPQMLAERIVKTMVCGRTTLPLFGLTTNEVVDVMQYLQYDTKGLQTRAERALAAIIREEITAGRFVPVLTCTKPATYTVVIAEHRPCKPAR